MDISKKFNGKYNKYLLRQSLPKIIPESVRWRNQKQGFRFQPNEFFKSNLQHLSEIVRKSNLLSDVIQSSNTLAKVPIISSYSLAVFESIYL